MTVSYTAPGDNPLQDAAALEAPSFTDEPVFNNTPNAEPHRQAGDLRHSAARRDADGRSTSGIRDDDGLSDPRVTPTGG